MPPGSGTSLGQATGTITINAQLTAAAQQIAQFSVTVTQQFNQVTQASNQAQNSLNSLIGIGKQLAGAFGVGVGIGGAVQLGKAAVAATELATAYNRQQVAAASLAGSQAQLNALLEVYDKATGGILDQSTELANVTQLMSVGFADSSKELEKFATAIRGISIATGRSSDIITQNLILELFSQRGMRLDQLGLQYDKVRQRADELQKADSTLTQQQAYQNAVLDEAQRKYGDLATSAVGGATGLEKLGKAAEDARLAIGEVLSLPVNASAALLAAYIQSQIDLLHGWERAWQDLHAAMQRTIGVNVPTGMTQRFVEGSAGRDVGRHPERDRDLTNPNQDKIDQEWSDRFDKMAEIEKQANADIEQENTSFKQRQIDLNQSYNEQVADSAASFAKQAVRAQEDYERSIVDVMRQSQQQQQRLAEDHGREIERMQRDSAQRISKLDDDLDHTIAQKRADSADKLAGFADDRDKKIEQDRKDSADRLLQLDKDYNNQRAQAQLAHQDTLSNAAARLDAFAVFEEQRRFGREQAQAAKSHDEKVDDEKAKLQKSIDQANTAYDEKVADEKKSLDKSIKQAQEAHDRQVQDEKDALQQRIDDSNEAYARQLADLQTADAARIAELAANYELEKTRRGNDQVDRLNQMAEHHTQDLTKLDTEHGTRLTQISTHAADERTAYDTEFGKRMKQLGVHNDAWDKAESDHQYNVNLSQGIFWAEQERAQADAQKKMIEILQQNPLLSPLEQAALTAASKSLDTTIGNLTKFIEQGKGLFKPTTNPNDTATDSAIISAASVTLPPAAQVSTSGNNTAVTIAAGAIVINGVSGQTATDLAGIIDQRIYNAVLRATGRG